MTTTSTVLHIKEATLALSRTVPCANITVSMVIQKVNIARSTFYKYFQNMTKVWHAITHDLMCSISTQMDQLYISSMHHFNDIQRQKILTFSELSPLTMANYFSKFCMQNSHVIRCLLIENMDPLFLVHWRNMTNEIFSEILLQNGYAAENVRCIADLLSYGLVDKCFLAIQRGDKQMLFDYYLASNKILHALCDQKKLLEQMTKHVSVV